MFPRHQIVDLYFLLDVGLSGWGMAQGWIRCLLEVLKKYLKSIHLDEMFHIELV